eukprot:Gb_09729 [translate_table: standard]
MAMAAEDALFKSLQRLPPMIESFNDSLSQLCKTNKNADALVLRKELEEYYRDLHSDLRKRYESLTQKEKPVSQTKSKTNEKASEETQKSGSAIAPSTAMKIRQDVKVRPEIQSLCDEMDGNWLRNYIVSNRKSIGAFRDELPVAFSKTRDAAKLVFKVLEGYDFSESASNRADKKESVASVNRRACILVLECLFPVFATDKGSIPAKVRDAAKEVVELWRKKMGIERNASSCNALDAQAFLQLLATFRIADEYEKDELVELVLAISRRKQTPDLCKHLGLSAKIPGIVQKLSQSGRQIEALRFARAFDIMEKVHPVTLLKEYLKDGQKAAQDFLKGGRNSAASLNDSTMKEVSTLKAVINAVEEYNLSNLYPTDGLQKRVIELEKAKAARKNTAANKAVLKRPRSPGSGDGTGGYAETKVTADIGLGRPPQRAKYASETELGRAAVTMGMPTHNLDAVQNNYESISLERYKSAYPGGNRSPLGTSLYGSSTAAGIFTTQRDYERRGPERYASAFSGGDKSSAMGAGGTYVAQSNYERRVPELYPSAFGGGSRSPIGSSAYASGTASGAFTNLPSNPAQGKYEGKALERYMPSLGGGNRSPVGSSVYGAGALKISSSGVAQSNYETIGREPYTSAFGGNKSAIGPTAFTLPSSNETRGNHERRGSDRYGSAFAGGNTNEIQGSYERRGPEHYTTAFAGGNLSKVGSSGSIYGSGATASAFATPSSTLHSYQLNSGLTSPSPAYQASFLR